MWHQLSNQGWAAGMLALASSFSWLPTITAGHVPAAPKLSFLYTAYVECEGNLMDTTVGPHGQRKAIPIVGGNFSGPHLSGEYLVHTCPLNFGIRSNKLPTFRQDSGRWG
jgi:hypothetical protein